jgi:predicted Mrr-cat superfamily restriction endonuclease
MSEAWRIRAWDDPVAERWFVEHNLVGISNDELVVHDNPDEVELRRRVQAAHSDRKPRAIDTFVRYWRNFLHDMQNDDVVAVPLHDRRVAIGVVLGPPQYDADLPTWARNYRPVEWVAGNLRRDDLPEDLRKTVNSMGTICRFNAEAASSRLLKIALGP